MPKISIILPVYNGEKYLKPCLNSLVNQTLQDIEIICINDCSTDLSLEILNEYAQNDTRIKIITNKTNQSQGYGRNLGIKLANAEYIMFIDQDDWYELNTCEKVYKQISENENDFLIFNIKYHYSHSGTWKIEKRRLIPFEKVLDKPNIKPYEVGTNIFCSSFIWCQIYQKKFILDNDIKFYNEKQSDDIPFFIKSMVNAKSISILPEPFYNYRIHEAQTTSSRTDLWQAVFRTRAIAYEEVLKSEHSESFLNPFLIYYINSVIYWFDYNTKINPKIKYSYYKKMRENFKIFNSKYNIENISKDINYKYFLRIINEPYFIKIIKDYFQKFKQIQK